MAAADAFFGLTLEELEDDVDVLEFIQSKNGLLDGFKTELLEQQKIVDSIGAGNTLLLLNSIRFLHHIFFLHHSQHRQGSGDGHNEKPI